MKQSVKISIRTKLLICLIGIIAFIIIISWVLSYIFIKSFYYKELKNDMIDTYESCNEVFDNDFDFDDESFSLNINNKADAVVYIVDGVNKKIFTSINEDNIMIESLRSIVELLTDDSVAAGNQGIIQKDVEYYDNFKIQISRDTRMQSSYFDLIGMLDNGYAIVLRAPVSRVDSVINSSIKFFTLILCGMAVIACIVIYFFSGIFTRPIQNLTKVAKRMADLDFNAKIENPSNDELGELSIYMNKLSYKLRVTLWQLQTANAELQKDIENKVRIDEMRKEFLSHISHELKTPIALIQGYAEGLRDNLMDDEESKNFYCDVIIDESAKMNTLVKKLLDLNEIEFGTDKVIKEKFDIVDLIRNRISSSTILTDKSNAYIEFNEHDPVWVMADEFMIEEVFTNYLTNALHYCRPDGRIVIWTQVMAADNVRISVYNEGDQIDDEEMNRIFEKFYKVDKARTREYGGSGIGLSIVAASMKAHGKNYGVYNVDDGVVFFFELDMVE